MHTFKFEGLDVYKLSVQVARWMRPTRWPSQTSHLKDQAIRAADSVVLNLSEGMARGGKPGENHLRIAKGSAGEALTSGHIGRLDDGTISNQAVDALGHEWNYIGRVGDLPELKSSLLNDIPRDVHTVDDTSEGEARGYVFVTEGPRDEWLTYELESFDAEAMAELDLAYAHLNDTEARVAEALKEGVEDRARIVGGTDDRVFLSNDQLTVGGSRMRLWRFAA